MKTFAIVTLLGLASSVHAAPEAALIRPIEQAQVVKAIERAECSHAYSAESADGEKLVFWRQWGTHEAYMNVRGKLTKLTYIDPGEYPEDKRLPYRQSWVGEGVAVTIQVTQEAFCAPDEEECDGVEQEGVIAVEQAERRESIRVAGYSGC
jgi:hypothetical protein